MVDCSSHGNTRQGNHGRHTSCTQTGDTGKQLHLVSSGHGNFGYPTPSTQCGNKQGRPPGTRGVSNGHRRVFILLPNLGRSRSNGEQTAIDRNFRVRRKIGSPIPRLYEVYIKSRQSRTKSTFQHIRTSHPTSYYPFWQVSFFI